MSVFDTPIQSDLDTSDLDETFSECDEIDVENVAALDKLVIPVVKEAATSVEPDHTYTDHCYIAPKQPEKATDHSAQLNLLTPAQSSEDEDIQKELNVLKYFEKITEKVPIFCQIPVLQYFVC